MARFLTILRAWSLAGVMALAPALALAQPPKPAYVTGTPTTSHCATWAGPQLLQDASCPAPANPTATCGTTAVNGSASTYMRSDAAPACPAATNSTKGLMEGDGTSITCSAGVCSTVGAGGGGSAPTLRGTPSTGSTTGTTTTLALPTGTVAGDFAIAASVGGDGASLSGSGWTLVGDSAGVWNLQVWTKTITSGDVSAGSFTVTAGSFIRYSFLATFASGAYVASYWQTSETGANSASYPNQVTTGPQVGITTLNTNELYLVFVSARAVNASMTATPGTLIGSAMTNASASAALYKNTFSSGLPLFILNHTAATNGNGDVVIGILAP